MNQTLYINNGGVPNWVKCGDSEQVTYSSHLARLETIGKNMPPFSMFPWATSLENGLDVLFVRISTFFPLLLFGALLVSYWGGATDSPHPMPFSGARPSAACRRRLAGAPGDTAACGFLWDDALVWGVGVVLTPASWAFQ